MKNITTLFSLLIFLVSCQERNQIVSKNFKTITIKTSGEIETLPNEASFHINLNCLKNTLKLSKDCLVQKSNEINQLLLNYGIKQEDILTTTVNMNRSYTWRNNSNVFEGYRSSSNMIVTVKKIDDLDKIYTELLENRNLELGGLSYQHADLDSLKNEAYANALKKANLTADKLLAELPESKKEILNIANVEISVPKPEQQRYYDAVEAEEAVANQSAINISAGTIKVNATLYVEYQIK